MATKAVDERVELISNDSDSDVEVEDFRKLTVHERDFGTIPPNENATKAALVHQTALGNPTVGRGNLKGKKQHNIKKQ